MLAACSAVCACVVCTASKKPPHIYIKGPGEIRVMMGGFEVAFCSVSWGKRCRLNSDVLLTQAEPRLNLAASRHLFSGTLQREM